jgi:hypothetical protein
MSGFSGFAGGLGVGTVAFDFLLSHLLLVKNGALIGLLFQVMGALSRLLGLPFFMMADRSTAKDVVDVVPKEREKMRCSSMDSSRPCSFVAT